MNDTLPFESPKWLLDSAKESIERFETDCVKFIESCEQRISADLDPETGSYILKIRFGTRIPARLRVKASEIIGHLRHALDQAMVSAAILTGRRDTNGVYFPFARNAAELDRQIGRYCRNVHPDLIEFARRLKPHYGGDTLLWTMSKIAGPSKHQQVIRLSIEIPGMTMSFWNPPTGTQLLSRWNEARNEFEYLRLPSINNVEMNLRYPVHIVLDLGEPPLNGPAAAILGALLGKAQSIVLGLEAEAMRIARAGTARP